VVVVAVCIEKMTFFSPGVLLHALAIAAEFDEVLENTTFNENHGSFDYPRHN
jgi:hypothetical protein